MKCTSCGRELPEGVAFCMFCGAKLEAPAPVQDAPEPEPVQPAPEPEVPEAVAEPTVAYQVAEPAPEAVEEPTVAYPAPAPAPEPAPMHNPVQDTAPQPVPAPAPVEYPAPAPTAPEFAAAAAPAAKPKKMKPWMLVIGIIAALAIIGGIAYGIYQSNLAKQRAEDYSQAQSLYAAGKYEEAAEAFAALEDYEDCVDMYKKCGLWIDAQKLEAAAGEDPAAWEKAADAYRKIGEPKANNQATTCQNTATFYSASQLMAERDWDGALALLDDLPDDFMGSDDLKQECEIWKLYEEAEALLADKHYYDAYELFNSLSYVSYEGMPDMNERAQACIQSFPSAGVVYRGDGYGSEDSELEIISNYSVNAFYKIYDGDTLVLSIAVPAGSSTAFWLPAGTYKLKECTGSNWFGTTDLFGDDGYYYTCTFGESDTFTLEYGYGYTLTTNTTVTEGTSVGSQTTDRSSF